MIIAFNSTYFYLIVCYAHMKIFLSFMRNISFIFIIIITGSAQILRIPFLPILNIFFEFLVQV